MPATRLRAGLEIVAVLLVSALISWFMYGAMLGGGGVGALGWRVYMLSWMAAISLFGGANDAAPWSLYPSILVATSLQNALLWFGARWMILGVRAMRSRSLRHE